MSTFVPPTDRAARPRLTLISRDSQAVDLAAESFDSAFIASRQPSHGDALHHSLQASVKFGPGIEFRNGADLSRGRPQAINTSLECLDDVDCFDW